MPQQVSGRGGVRAGGIAGGQDDQGETGAEHGQALADFEGEPVTDCCLGGMPVAGTAQCCRSSCDAVLPRIAGLGPLHECEGLREIACGCGGEDGDLAAIEDAPADAAVGFDVPQGLRPADVLDTALVRSGEHLQDLPALGVGNPTLDNALADHVYSLIHDNDVDTRRLESIIGALTDPSAAWESALQAASEDQDAARNAAVVMGALTAGKSGSAPADLADRLGPVVRGADPDATQALGEAVALLPRQVRKKLDDALPRDSQNRARRTAFRKAADL
ncbi:hypothetical protein [Kitasatospora indigofera]|uniref:hypothetical protein n=1 Tax=Kitasatospora indigofera TaxID=67307 RepID=UPI0036B05395